MQQKPLTAKIYDWLIEESRLWQQEGLINTDQSQAITASYSRYDAKPWMAWVLVLLAVLFIGGGVILLLAHNWQELGRLARALIALLPLLVMQGVCFFLAWRERSQSLLGEACAIALAAAQGAAIALIAQTYHAYGALWQYFLLWFLMAFPSALLLRSRALFVASMVLLCAIGESAPWLYAVQDDSLWANVWKAPSPSGEIILVGLIVGLIYAFRFAGLVERWAVLLAVIYTLLILHVDTNVKFLALIFLAYYGLGATNDIRGWRNPLRSIASVGIVVLLLWIMLFEVFKYQAFPVGYESVVLVSVVLWLWRKQPSALKKPTTWVMLLTPCLVIVLPLIVDFGAPEWVYFVLAQAWVLFSGLLLTYSGLQEERLLKTNTGLFLLLVLLLNIFFDSGWMLLARGLGLIVAGVLLLLINVWLLRRRKV
ncbi:DUF2157 domain-containing protein [Suttonella sp. R2A3]|uniref:DUF2157 domain-containing protein n=1 Tax=Suttonella sp. R2A3 TaxID=2908648 RepID=UPI001F36D6E4|nr:DUF2157 domain-containing protein [Suttonella sp. R2A3]UJF23820.1 DUF2157 domain-containing protein [Suttonella sp. R2A3]